MNSVKATILVWQRVISFPIYQCLYTSAPLPPNRQIVDISMQTAGIFTFQSEWVDSPVRKSIIHYNHFLFSFWRNWSVMVDSFCHQICIYSAVLVIYYILNSTKRCFLWLHAGMKVEIICRKKIFRVRGLCIFLQCSQTSYQVQIQGKRKGVPGERPPPLQKKKKIVNGGIER